MRSSRIRISTSAVATLPYVLRYRPSLALPSVHLAMEPLYLHFLRCHVLTGKICALPSHWLAWVILLGDHFRCSLYLLLCSLLPCLLCPPIFLPRTPALVIKCTQRHVFNALRTIHYIACPPTLCWPRENANFPRARYFQKTYPRIYYFARFTAWNYGHRR